MHKFGDFVRMIYLCNAYFQQTMDKRLNDVLLRNVSLLTKYVVSTKFVKRLEKTEFYEMRVSVGNNEYRTVLFAIDADNFMECHRMVILNSFVEKGTKQYPAEIKKAERLLKEWEASL